MSYVVTSQGWRKGMPWLYYTGDYEVALRNIDAMPFEVSFDKTDERDNLVHELKYFITSCFAN